MEFISILPVCIPGIRLIIVLLLHVYMYSECSYSGTELRNVDITIGFVNALIEKEKWVHNYTNITDLYSTCTCTCTCIQYVHILLHVNV